MMNLEQQELYFSWRCIILLAIHLTEILIDHYVHQEFPNEERQLTCYMYMDLK